MSRPEFGVVVAFFCADGAKPNLEKMSLSVSRNQNGGTRSSFKNTPTVHSSKVCLILCFLRWWEEGFDRIPSVCSCFVCIWLGCWSFDTSRYMQSTDEQYLDQAGNSKAPSFEWDFVCAFSIELPEILCTPGPFLTINAAAVTNPAVKLF